MTDKSLHIDERKPRRDIIANDYNVGLEHGIVLGGGGVVKFEAVGPVVEGYVEDEGLVEVTEWCECSCGGVGG